MKQAPFRLGPLALLLTVIGICLTVLAVLSFATAGADLRLAERHAETVQTRYALEQQGQAFLAALTPNAVPTGLEADESGVYEAEFSQNNMMLRVGVVPDDQGWRVVRWTVESAWEQSGHIGNLWKGD